MTLVLLALAACTCSSPSAPPPPPRPAPVAQTPASDGTAPVACGLGIEAAGRRATLGYDFEGDWKKTEVEVSANGTLRGRIPAEVPELELALDGFVPVTIPLEKTMSGALVCEKAVQLYPIDGEQR